MRTLARKTQIFEDAGYFYHFDREMYVNRPARKVFSIDFVEAHSEEDLEARILEPSPPVGEWSFYFISPPSEGVRRELRKILD